MEDESWLRLFEVKRITFPLTGLSIICIPKAINFVLSPFVEGEAIQFKTSAVNTGSGRVRYNLSGAKLGSAFA